MLLGKRLRRWLRGAAVQSSDILERDYLPELPATEWLQAAATGADPSVGPAEFAIALLTAARDGDPDLRAAVVDGLAAADARWWLALDEALRQRWWWAPRWSLSVAADLVEGELDVLCLAVAACHHNGRIREAAVVRLAGQTHPAAIAVLALRACDWVVEVRQRARMVVDNWPSPLGGLALTTSAELAFALRGRREGGWLAERVEGILQVLPRQHLEALLLVRDRATRRMAYRAAIATSQLSLERLTEAAVRDRDLPVRTMCALAAVRAATDPAQLRRLLISRTALVRAEALRALTVSGELAVAEAALPDRHPLVREVAQAVIRRAGLDPAAHYRRFAALKTAEPGAIAGLGETGGLQDAAVVEQWLSHPRARGRVEAIRALRRLGVLQPAALMRLLRDESGAVTRQAAATLRHEGGTLDPTALGALLDRENAPHIRFAGYRLLIAGDAWQRLATNLRLLDDPDERLRATSRADLATWLERDAATTYRAPSRDRAAELDKLIERASPALDEHKVRLLRFHAGLGAAS